MAKATRRPAPLPPSPKAPQQRTASKSTKPGARRTYLAALCQALEKAAAGLTHRSESDYPYRFFALLPPSLPPAEGQLTIPAFLSSLGLSPAFVEECKVPLEEWIEERPLADFFPTAQDIAACYGLWTSHRKVVAESRRYRNLEKVLRKRLWDVKVFRLGRIDVRCYIAGFSREGNLAGLVTTAIET